MNTPEPQPVTTGNDLRIHGERILKVLKDAGFIEDKELYTVADFMIDLRKLVRDVDDAYYDNSTDHHEAIKKLKKFVGITDND